MADPLDTDDVPTLVKVTSEETERRNTRVEFQPATVTAVHEGAPGWTLDVLFDGPNEAGNSHPVPCLWGGAYAPGDRVYVARSPKDSALVIGPFSGSVPLGRVEQVEGGGGGGNT